MRIEELESLIRKAEGESLVFKDVEDGGTSNFDTPIIKRPEGIKPKELQQLSWQVTPVGDKGFKGWYFLYTRILGQGDRRTAMAEAVAKYLNNNGVEASVYYQMD